MKSSSTHSAKPKMKLWDHATKLNTNWARCNHCLKVINTDRCSTSTVTQHLKIHHNIHIPKRKKDLETSQHYCEDCNMTFPTAFGLEFHIVTDHERDEGPFTCSHCSKQVEDRISLKTHLKAHMKNRRTICPV